MHENGILYILKIVYGIRLKDLEGDRMKNGRTYAMFRYLYIALIAAAIVAFFCFAGMDNSTAGISCDDVRYIDNWTVTDAQGNSFEVGRSYTDERLLKEDFTVTAVLPENISDGYVMCFVVRSDVEVYIDGSLRKDFIRSRDVRIPGGSVKNFYMTVPLYASDSGREVTMVRHRTDRNLLVAPETVIIPGPGVYQFLFAKYGLSFVLSLALFSISAIVVMVALLMRLSYRRPIQMLYGALGIFVVSAWLVFNSYMCPYVLGHMFIDGVMSYFCTLIMPFGLLIYINSIQKRRHDGIITVLLVLSLVNAVVWTFLHFSGIMSFAVSLPYIDVVMGIIIIILFYILYREYKEGHTGEYGYMAMGLSIFMIMCVVELFTLIFKNFKSNEIPMLIGLLILLLFIILQQIEDLKQINEDKQRAIELSDAKTSFLASMSHEIRTPINSILGMNEMILRENHDTTINNYARDIRNSGRMLLSLVNDVLDFSKIESGKMEITKVDFSLSEMLSDVVKMTRERALAKSLDFELMIDEGVPDGLHSDDVRLKQVLINLINNAVKYTDKGSIWLKVSAQRTGDECELVMSVKDEGRGIKKEEQNKLFDAFTRADINKNRNIEGTGLGLAIVKSIVDSMEGTIGVESEYLKGSEFTVRVPVEVTDETAVSAQFDTGGEQYEKEDYICDYLAPDARVLAVDDNRTNLNIVKLFLKRTGIVPVLLNSGRKAIEQCMEEKFDLILLDHMMPDIDGIKTLEMIRNEESSLNKDTPAIVLTANAVAGSRQMYLEAGFEDYISKPIDSRLLEEMVKTYLPKERIISNGPEEKSGGERGGMMKEKLSVITGLDYETALTNSGGDEEILAVVIGEITGECEERIEMMRGYLDEKNYKDYGISAHAIKGLMATIGVMGLSERAKRHEFAAKEDNIDFILEDCDGFLDEYAKLCKMLANCL